MEDPRARHFARLARLRASARRWSVLAGGLITATAVLLPYHGVGLPDVGWAAAAGASSVLAAWRWVDARSLAAQPAPRELTEAERVMLKHRRLESAIEWLPIGRTAVVEMRRVAHMSRVRGSAAAPIAARLDRAVKAFTGLAPRLTGPGAEVAREAQTAEYALRDLAERIASVERAAIGGAAPDALPELVARFGAGVDAYEALVGAAAAYVAEEGRLGEPVATGKLIEAGDLLRGIAEGMSEFRAGGASSGEFRPRGRGAGDFKTGRSGTRR